MYDPGFNEYFNKRSKETKWWDGGEPLWVTARKQGLKSAAYFWPGDEAKIKGLRPNIYFKFDGTIPFRSRIDSAVKWLSDDIDIVMVYLSEPDSTGHLFGPNTPQVRSKVKEMDDLLGYIVEEFDKASLWNSVNVIITSDHGMTEVDYANKHVDLSNFIDMNAVDAIPTTGPTANILPRLNMEQEIIDNLTNVPHIKVYSKDDIPEHWHYKEHRRILPVLVVAEEGWVALKVYI
jgi:predicted AlkP superfamily pyrophosphatase or phosphodiesterase